MKKLVFEVGGRPRANDDLQTLQGQLYAALYATLQDAPPMVLSGCVVSRGGGLCDITPGYIWIDGSIEYYAGISSAASPCEVVKGPAVLSDFRAYQTGGSKACMSEQELITQAKGTAAPGTARLAFVAGPELTYGKYLESQGRSVGEVQWQASHTASHYDGTGRGWQDLPARGWALCNGENGTADLRGRFVVAFDDRNSDYAAIGNTGGEAQVALTLDQMPRHSHSYEDRYTEEERGTDAGSQIRRVKDRTEGKTTGAQGNGGAHENRPPFYTLIARQWVGL